MCSKVVKGYNSSLMHQHSVEYVVQGSDTLERIAARHDCTPSELMKLNKLHSRIVFSGQKLLVPDPNAVSDTTSGYRSNSVDEFSSSGSYDAAVHRTCSAGASSRPAHLFNRNQQIRNRNTAASDDPPEPATAAVFTHAEIHHKPVFASASSPVPAKSPHNAARNTVSFQLGDRRETLPEEDEIDVECLQRFLKLNVKQFTDNEGVVNGVLLVTPNCIMFDPDLNHPLVRENGPEAYGMIAKMEDIVSTALYKDISAMTGEVGDEKAGVSPTTSCPKNSVENAQIGTQTGTNNATTSAPATAMQYRNSVDAKPVLSDIPEVTSPEAKPETSPDQGGSKGQQSLELLQLPGSSSIVSRSSSDNAAAGGPVDLLKRQYSSGSSDGGQYLSADSFDHGSTPLFARHSSCPPSIGDHDENQQRQVQEALLAECIAAAATDEVPPPLEPPDSPAVFLRQKEPVARVPGLEPEPLLVTRDDSTTTGSAKKESFLRGRFRSFHKTASSQMSLPKLSVGTGGKIRSGKQRSASSSSKPDDVDELEVAAESDLRKLSSLTRKLSKQAKTVTGAVGSGVQQVGGALTSGVQQVGGALTTGVKEVGGALTTGAHQVGGVLTTGVKEVGGVLTSGAQAVGGAAQVVGGALQTGAQNMGEVLTTGAQTMGEALQTGAHQLAAVPRNIVNTASEIFNVEEEVPKPSPDSIAFKRQQSYQTLEKLKQKSEQARAQATQNSKLSYACATSRDEKPDLFSPIEDMLPPLYSANVELPYFLCVRLNKRKLAERLKRLKESHHNDDDALLIFGNKQKVEYWFTCPKDRADGLYAFLLQWSPECANPESDVENVDLSVQKKLDDHEGFVMIDAHEVDEHLKCDQTPSVPSSALSSNMLLNLNREWEILTVEEVKRRLSILDEIDVSKFPLPEGSTDSTILNEEMIRTIVSILPARAEGYPWVLVYSTADHGFSLKTLYRKMSSELTEQISPTLLIVRDTSKNVFGAIVSGPLHVAEHFYGTGESRLFTFYPEFTEYTWSGENMYFCKGSLHSLAVGAGKGKFGLWLDADLYHGRTQHCDTFGNKPLTSTEDFIVESIEAFRFSM